MPINVSPELFIGIMSGTSADGIDVAIVSCSHRQTKLLQFSEFPMPEDLRQSILSLAVSGDAEIEAIHWPNRTVRTQYHIANHQRGIVNKHGLANLRSHPPIPSNIFHRHTINSLITLSATFL